MYDSYWQLETRPFESTADRRFYYPGESHQGALLKLRYATEHRRGAALLTGDSGTGKTLLVTALKQQLSEAYRPFVHLIFPQMPYAELLAYFAERLGAPPADRPRHTVEESVRRLEFLLAENSTQGRHAVLVVDEAHLLVDCGTLETLRLLTNFEHEGRSSLTLLLVGQTALLPALGRMPSLEQRIGVKALLRDLTADETAAYIQHRMAAAGAKREIFDASAVETVYALTHGVAREINRLCDLALLIGYAEGLATIASTQIEAVSQELVCVAPE